MHAVFALVVLCLLLTSLAALMHSCLQQHPSISANACIGLLAPLAAGGAVILPAGGGFSATTFWKDAAQFNATFYTAVPTMHQV